MTSNPWDVAPIPSKADANEDATLLSVARALRQWETFEVALGRLFSVFLSSDVRGDWRHGYPARRAYGAVSSFQSRADMVLEAGNTLLDILQHFAEPDVEYLETLRKRLKDLIKRARNYSARRNECAHGIVREWWDGRGRNVELYGYALYPADYNSRKWELPEAGEAFLPHHPLGFNSFIYTSVEIDVYAGDFSELATEASALAERFIGAFPLPPLP